MPVQKYSAMDPGGSWVDDARDTSARWNATRGDQWAQFNTSRGDQKTAEDWRKEVALAQIAQGDRFYQGNRQESALDRAARADAEKAKYGYMTSRDTLGDQRWQQTWDQDRADREEDRNWKYEGRARDTEEYDALKPKRDIEMKLALAQLEDMQRRQTARTGAAGAAAYNPLTDEGKQEYQSNLAMTGDPLQAGFASKAKEREQAGMRANAAKASLESALQDFKAKDASMFGSDPSPQDQQGIFKQVEALKVLLVQAGVPADTADETVKKILRDNLTVGGRTDMNQGPSEEVISRYGGSFR